MSIAENFERMKSQSDEEFSATVKRICSAGDIFDPLRMDSVTQADRECSAIDFYYDQLEKWVRELCGGPTGKQALAVLKASCDLAKVSIRDVHGA